MLKIMGRKWAPYKPRFCHVPALSDSGHVSSFTSLSHYAWLHFHYFVLSFTYCLWCPWARHWTLNYCYCWKKTTPVSMGHWRCDNKWSYMERISCLCLKTLDWPLQLARRGLWKQPNVPVGYFSVTLYCKTVREESHNPTVLKKMCLFQN